MAVRYGREYEELKVRIPTTGFGMVLAIWGCQARYYFVFLVVAGWDRDQDLGLGCFPHVMISAWLVPGSKNKLVALLTLATEWWDAADAS